jgi:hypothetical protein
VNSNILENSVTELLNKYSIEDILFSLYCSVDNRAKNLADGEQYKDLTKQIHALNVACEIIEEDNDDDSYCLIY